MQFFSLGVNLKLQFLRELRFSYSFNREGDRQISNSGHEYQVSGFKSGRKVKIKFACTEQESGFDTIPFDQKVIGVSRKEKYFIVWTVFPSVHCNI